MVWRMAVRPTGAAGRGGEGRSRALVSAGVVLTVVLAGAGFALGRNAAAGKVSTHSGEAWLSTRDD